MKRAPEVWTLEDSLDELGELARSSGARVVGAMEQLVNKPTQTYLGRGKLEELRLLAQRSDFDTVVCDDELTPSQQRNLENALVDVKVIDRTAMILDVFARRAQTHEGRLQVELAQSEYLLPRLAGQWTHLERLGGGIGTRGPGETQIETDRRQVRTRVQKIKKDLEDVRRHRGRYRAKRAQIGIPVATLVGYTNAGKSTLLNSLTGADVVSEDKLFATLDPVTRRVRLPSGTEILLTDTVGFIHKLPPKVVAAFRATLEEALESTVMLHVVDISHRNAAAQVDVVSGILRDLGLADKPQVLVLNKTDLVEGVGGTARPLSPGDFGGGGHPQAVFVSALTGLGLERLLTEIETLIAEATPASSAIAAV